MKSRGSVEKPPSCAICRTPIILGKAPDPDPICGDVDACRTTIAEEALERFGLERQLLALAEECNELSAVILRRANIKADDAKVMEEIADVFSLALQRERFAIWADCGLGKTAAALAWIRSLAPKLVGKKVLIIAPLMVLNQWLREEEKFYKMRTIFDAHDASLEEWASDPSSPQVAITNHDKFHEAKKLENIGAVVLDESSIIKHAEAKTRTALVESFKGIQYKLCLSATPAPNDREEYANHATFLEYVRSNNEFYSMFFVNRDNGWELKPHGIDAFHRYLATWSVYCQNPERYGFEDVKFQLPPPPTFETVKLDWTPEQARLVQRQKTITGQTETTPDAMTRKTFYLRLSKGIGPDGPIPSEKRTHLVATIRKHVQERTIVWCQYNDEQALVLEDLANAGFKPKSIDGSTSEQERLRTLEAFELGEFNILVSKPRLLGFGLNLPYVTVQIFNGFNESFETFYQAVRRSYRFGSKTPLKVYLPVTPVERQILKTVLDKKNQWEHDSRIQEDAFIRQLGGELDAYFGREFSKSQISLDQVHPSSNGTNYKISLGDCVPNLRCLKVESVDLAVFSPPFASLFTYSNHIADMGNATDPENEFALHFEYVLEGLRRVLKPGRVICCHVSQLATLKSRDGYVGLRDFRGDVIRLFQKNGFTYFGEWAIAKNPQMQAIKEKVRSLAFAQLENDRLGSKPGLSDFILIFKKPGDAEAKINDKTGPTRDEWIEWACGVWTGIRESDTLNVRGTKSEDDVKHICPMNLEQVRRCIRMYSKPGEVILDPFTGIGTTGVIAIEQGRRFVGFELKEEYYKQAVENLQRVERSHNGNGNVDLKRALRVPSNTANITNWTS